MPCKCNTAQRDPGCTIGHSMSELHAAIAFPNLDRSAEVSNIDLDELATSVVCKALDDLLMGIGLLPLGQVTSRPVLHKAVDRGIEVLDGAVKRGYYVVQTGN